MSEDETSREQRQWQKLAATVGEALAKIALRLQHATPAEAHQFVQACQEGLRLATWAATYDHDVEATLTRPPFDNN
jgi:hypothetical protein